jgi:hypothetical protein
MLAAPGDSKAFAQGLEQLLRDPELRLRFGRAGRQRLERHFRIEQTVAPLIKLFQNASDTTQSDAPSSCKGFKASEAPSAIAYLMDRWPDGELPQLEREIEQMKRRDVPFVPVVCEFDSNKTLSSEMKRLAPSFEFLPDAIVLEAEWRANPVLTQQLEEDRAQQSSRAPGAIFLREGRFALGMRKLIQERNLSHIHATSSRALVCALMLRKILNVTVSATIESRPSLSRDWIHSALSKCTGGRVSNLDFAEQLSGAFLLDKTTFRSVARKTLGQIGRTSRFGLTTGSRFWQQWEELLLGWIHHG